MAKAERHRLSGVDLATRRASCSVCGVVRAYRNGKYWTCSVKAQAASRAWQVAHPERVMQLRGASLDRSKSRPQHRLSEFDSGELSAVCAICGPVGLRRWGPRLICEVRADSLSAGSDDTCGFCSSPGKGVWTEFAGRAMCLFCQKAWVSLSKWLAKHSDMARLPDGPEVEEFSELGADEVQRDARLYWEEVDPETGVPYRRRPYRDTSSDWHEF